MQLANSDQAASRANRDIRVAACGTSPCQLSIRSRLIAATVTMCCRCTFALVPCPTQAERPPPTRSFLNVRKSASLTLSSIWAVSYLSRFHGGCR